MPPCTSGNGITRLIIQVAMLIFYTIGTSSATLYYARNQCHLAHSLTVWQSKYGYKYEFDSEMLTART